MEDVQLVQRQQVDIALDELKRHEMAAAIQHAAAPAKARGIFDLHAGAVQARPVTRRARKVWRQKLPQGLGGIEQPGRGGAASSMPSG